MIAYETALSSQDWKRIAPLLHDDVCVTFSSGTFKGKAEVQQAFERTFALIQDEQYAISNLHWAVDDGAVAICLYDFAWQGVINGQPASGGGRGTSVIVKNGAVWQIVAEHLGPHPSPAKP